MSLCVYISGHGFGHAARAVEVINAVVRRRPSLPVVVRTTVPRWFLDASLAAPVERIEGPTDTGVIQPDTLSIDEEATARSAAAFYGGFAARVDDERAMLRRRRVALVAGDIPPLAFAAAAAAGIPSVALGNFTWDWIYGGYPGFDTLAPGVRRLVADADAQATLALRMPFHGGFDGMTLEDVPLVARRARHGRADTRRLLNLDETEPLVLASFGGHGGGLPLEQIADRGRFTIVATDYGVDSGPMHRRLRVCSNGELRAAGVSYTDLLAATDVVATKLGYGIVSECIANGVPMLYTTRGRFREQEVFERELPAVMRCAAIGREQLVAGEWSDAIERLLSQPSPPGGMASNGAEVVAGRLLDFVHTYLSSM